MLVDEIKAVIERAFKQEPSIDFTVIDDAKYEVVLPGERLPVVGVNDLARELSATRTINGPGFRDVLLEGQYKGRRVTLHLRGGE